MKKIIHVNHQSEINPSKKWVDSKKFDSKDTIVDHKGKSRTGSNGRHYKLVEKKEMRFSTAQRLTRALVGSMLVIPTGGLSLIFKPVRNLFIQNRTKVYYAVPSYPMTLQIEMMCYQSNPCQHDVVFTRDDGQKHYDRLSSSTIYAVVKHYPELFGKGKLSKHFHAHESENEQSAEKAKQELDAVMKTFETGQNQSTRDNPIYGKVAYYDGIVREGVLNNNRWLYVGQILDGLPHGKGALTFHKSKSHYEGDFKQGRMHGKGILKTASGDVFEGEYQYDKRLRGISKYSNGTISEEEYKDGKHHGKRIETFPDGRKRISHWAEDKLDGTLEIFDKTGKLVSKSEYQDGKLLYEEAL